MSTSFVVVPPVKFRQPDQLTRLNHLFANKVGVTINPAILTIKR